MFDWTHHNQVCEVKANKAGMFKIVRCVFFFPIMLPLVVCSFFLFASCE